MLIKFFFSQNKTILHKIVMNYLLSTLLCYLIICINLFFNHFCILIYNKVYPRYFQRKKKMSVNEVRDFLWKHYYQLTGFCKGRSFFNETLQIDKKISNPRIAKEHYQSFKRKKNTN